MNILHKKVATAIATGALLVNSVLPVFAGVTIEISGNGTSSDNDANVTVKQETTVQQSNNAMISNRVEANADTGQNEANKNTGGSASVQTGDAEVTVDVTNSVNSNSAEVGCCGVGDVDVLISGNGYKSDNTVTLRPSSSTSVWQDNKAFIDNSVAAGAYTGGNEANKNTGGDASVETGDAEVTVTIANKANANSARVGDGSGGGSLSARIIGNGAKSDNDIDLALKQGVSLTQWNFAMLHNRVEADAGTGDNEANKNTGGDASVETGDAEVTVGIDNMANFNWADVDCGCLFDVLAKIAGNGYKSDNDIKASLVDSLEVFQNNFWTSDGGRRPCRPKPYKPCGDKGDDFVDADAYTGGNEANKNTGDPSGDPSVETGDAIIDVGLENTGNVNIFGEAPELEIPDFLGGFSINISLDLSALLEWLGLA